MIKKLITPIILLNLYNYLIGKLNNSDGFSFFISLSEISFEIIIFNKNKFVFFNSFEY